MRYSMNQAYKKGQERAVNNIEAVMRNRIADKYFRIADESSQDLHERGVTAGLLTNFAKIMDSDLGQKLTTSQDFGPYVMEVWPLVTAWYAEFPLKDLISVQDMDKPLAYMFFSCLKAGTNKSDTIAGEVVETATGPRTIKGKYPTGEIVGELIQGADIKFDGTGARDLTMALLAYAPLNIEQIPGYYDKIKIDVWYTGNATTTPSISLTPFKISGDTITLGYDNSGTFTETLHTLDAKTGLFTFDEGTSASATTVIKIVANYVWNLDYATTENIQTVKEEVELRPMEATPRALMLEWTLFSEYLKKSQFGQDIRESNIKRMLSLLYQYQVRYILDEMWTYAGVDLRTNSANDITIPGGTAVSVDVKAQQVSQALKNIANMIEINSGRIEGNRIVCGKNFKSFLESLPSTLFQISKSATDYGFSTPRELGTFGTFKVYYDPQREADEAMMTYRGSEFYDAAYYLGEYMPCVPTDAIALGVTVRSSFVSMEAYRFDKKNCVVKMKIVNG